MKSPRGVLLGALLAAIGLGSIVVVPAAEAATAASMTPSFTPDRLGARAAFTLALSFAGAGHQVPSPVRSTVVHLPAGLGIDVRGARVCALQTLRNHGGSACPSGSLIGRGHALLEAQLGALVITETATLQAFRGPNRGARPVIEISGQGLTPLVERITFAGVLLADRAPYGSKLEMSIPPIPTIPTEPDASTVKFSLTLGAGASAGQHNGSITVPSRCPKGGFPFGADFKFADGSSTSTNAPISCP